MYTTNPFEPDSQLPQNKYPEPTEDQLNRYKYKLRYVNVNDLLAIYRMGLGSGHPDRFTLVIQRAWEESGRPEVRSVSKSSFGETVDRMNAQYYDHPWLRKPDPLPAKAQYFEKKSLKSCVEIWRNCNYAQRLKFINDYYGRRKNGVPFNILLKDIADPGWYTRQLESKSREVHSTDWNEDADYRRAMRQEPEVPESLASFHIAKNFKNQEDTTPEQYKERVKKSLEDLKGCQTTQ